MKNATKYLVVGSQRVNGASRLNGYPSGLLPCNYYNNKIFQSVIIKIVATTSLDREFLLIF